MKNKAAIFSNERTVASAGSGKTYALTNRFIALSRRCNPESVCALTFTRMAAGEFLDKILTKLADAVLNPEYASYLAKELSELSGENIPDKEFFPLLKKITAALPNLSLSTIDAFEMRFASAFAAELGMFGEIRVMDDFQAARAKRRVLKIVLSKFAADSSSFESFSTAVSVANGGKLEKDISQSIISFIEKSQSFYRSFPDLSKWGNLKLLEKCERYRGQWDSERYAGLLAELLQFDDSKCRPLGGVKTFFKNSALGRIYKVSSKGALWLREYARRRFCGESGSGEYDGVVSLSPQQLCVVDGLLDILIGGTIRLMCDTAKAVGAIVSAYDIVYAREILERGNLSFDDLPAVLSDPSFAFERSLVEYRLDARYKHWLLDEFQDTSRAQWSVLENLIAEILSDDSGDRTAYYVGDMKQSIYGWRGGDPELFDEIFKKYSGSIREGRALNESRRSSLPVISAVNAIFSTASISQFGEAALIWENMWTPHTSHKSCGTDGCAAYVEVGEEDSKIKAIYNILRQIDPMGRGLQCAVLTYKNKQVGEIIDGLRSEAKRDGFALSVAGDIECSISDDNMAVPAMLALLKSCAHPSDAASLAYVKMTPLGEFAGGPDWRENALKKISSEGIEKFLSEKFMHLKKNGVFTGEFSRARFKNLIDAAAEFDAEFPPDIDNFLEFAKSYKVRESSKQSSVRVMTFHKSKGLDFDFVILPELGNSGGKNSSLRLHKISVGGGCTVINLPSQEVCGFSGILSEAYGKWQRKFMLESVCRLYVGVTRAKKGLYFIGKPCGSLKKSNAKFSFEKLIAGLVDAAPAENFAGNCCKIMFGDLNWYLNSPIPSQPSKSRKIGWLKNPKLPDLPPLEKLPSDDSARVWDKFSYSPAGKTCGRSFGIVVHAIFQSFCSKNPRADLDAFCYPCENAGADVLADAKEAVARCLENPEIFSIFADSADFKNEFSFSVMEDDCIVSGVFDRLNIFKDGDGRVERVEIIDYKTDALQRDAWELASAYSKQMSMYAYSAAKLFNLDKSKIRVRVVSVNSSTIADCL